MIQDICLIVCNLIVWMKMEQKVDILIVGAGVVGATLAALLVDTGYRIALVDAGSPDKAILKNRNIDDRVYAISPQNRQLLIEHGIWGHIPAERITAIRQMQIQEGEKSQPGLTLDALDVKADALAYIVENTYLQKAALEKFAHSPKIETFMVKKIHALQVGSEEVVLTLDDKTIIESKLVVGADGARSFIREMMQSQVRQHDYQQQAVIAHFHCEKPHQGVAYQWFYPEGILAWLPLPGNHISMVWSINQPYVEQLLTLPAEELSHRVAEKGNHQLGQLSLLNTPRAFPLSLTHVSQWVSSRMALVGDAAHTVHPLAGLGLNLGLSDVAALANVLREKGALDPGRLALLRQYERERREATYKVQGVTHILKTLFNNTNPILVPLRRWGLGLVERLGPFKKKLIRQVTTSI